MLVKSTAPLCLLVATLAWSAPAAAAGGDLDGNGRADEADIRLVEGYLEGAILLQDSQIQAADIDGDGKITAADRDALVRRVRGIAVPKAPATVQLDSASSGVVVDRETGQPLAGVEVAIPDEGIVVRTDAEGRFRLPASAKGKILTARASNFAPSAQAVDRGGGFQVALERLTPRLKVLDEGVHHLGDNRFSASSANAGQFRLRSEGIAYRRSFRLKSAPSRDLMLRIGSIIGIDTRQAAAAGQTAGGNPARKGTAIFLNDRLISRINVNGDNLKIALPRWLLVPGRNELRLATDRAGGSINFLGIEISGSGDYDDIEFAQLLLEDPAGEVELEPL